MLTHNRVGMMEECCSAEIICILLGVCICILVCVCTVYMSFNVDSLVE